MSEMSRRKTMASAFPVSGGSENIHPAAAAAADGRKSLAPLMKPSAVGGMQSQRKSSIGAGRRTSLAPGRRSSVMGVKGAGAAPKKDPRPTGDKEFQKKLAVRLIKFLSTHNYDLPISNLATSAPSLQEFRAISQCLVHAVDPNFNFTVENFEEEFRTFFAAMGYPFQINKSSLKSPGSPVAWSYLLACLEWMVELVESVEQEDKAQEDTPLTELPNQDLFWLHLKTSYARWLSGVDGNDVDNQELADIFAQRDADTAERSAKLEGEVARLTTEVEALKAAATVLPDLRTRRAQLLSDEAKFVKLIERMKEHHQGLQSKLREREVERDSLEAQLSQLRAQKEQLEQQIREQPFTPQEVMRMNQEKQMGEEALAQTAARRDELRTKIWDLEMACSKALQRLEQAVNDFNDKATEQLLVPATAKNNLDRVDFDLSFNPAGETLQALLGRDLTRSIKPAMQRLRSMQAERLRNAQLEAGEATQRTEQQRLAQAEREAEVSDLRQRVERAEAAFQEERKNVNAELERLVKQVEDVEREVQQLQGAVSERLASSERELRQATEACEHFELDSAEEFRALNQELCTMMDAISSHKERVTQVLEAILTRAQEAKDTIA